MIQLVYILCKVTDFKHFIVAQCYNIFGLFKFPNF